MYVIREIMHCKPGRVQELVGKFKGLGSVMRRLGYEPFRICTDVSGEQFWTVVLESEAESLNAFREMEEAVMADDEARKVMSGYHDLVRDGRREIYRVEA